jgi:hypothetical protein
MLNPVPIQEPTLLMLFILKFFFLLTEVIASINCSLLMYKPDRATFFKVRCYPHFISLAAVTHYHQRSVWRNGTKVICIHHQFIYAREVDRNFESDRLF